MGIYLLLTLCQSGAEGNSDISTSTFPFNNDGMLQSTNFVEPKEITDEDIFEDADGKRCVDKVEMVEDVEYDEVMECHLVDKEECSSTVKTNYMSEEELECKETFKKNCRIEKDQVVKTTSYCCTTLIKDCTGVDCLYSEGEEACQDKTQTVVEEAPRIVCTLEQALTCKNVTRMVPKLGPSENCVLVTKEVCQKKEVNRRVVVKPVYRRWCYDKNSLKNKV